MRFTMITAGGAMLPLLWLVFGCQPLRAQNDPGKGWVEGVLITEKGKPACENLNYQSCASAVLAIRPKEGNGIKTGNDSAKGGSIPYAICDLVFTRYS